MELLDLKLFVESKGASAFLKSFDNKNKELLQVCAQPTDNTVAPGWVHAIFIEKKKKQWVIGFSQFGTTHPLDDGDLRNLVDAWILAPSDEHFKSYET